MRCEAKENFVHDTNHFVCPFVKNTSSSINGQLYAIGGDIWVNYTNSWN